MQMAVIAKGFSGFQRDSVMFISSLNGVVLVDFSSKPFVWQMLNL
jgi:hypothetical protein